MFSLSVDADTRLELLEEHDAAELFAVVDRNRAYLRRWLPWLDQNTSPEHTRMFIRANLQQFAARNGFACGIRHQGALVGVIGLHAIDWTNRKTSLGYWLDESSQGKGLISRACAKVLDHVFAELGLHLVEIGCAVGNDKSCAIPERLGFKREGVQRQREWLYDHYVDHFVFTMLASEWRERREG
jgi:ribosomal-protein-serine acetyltransferase